MGFRAIFYIAFATFLFTGFVHAGDEQKLTGSNVKVEDATRHSDVIFVGQVTTMGIEYQTPETSMAYAGPLYNAVKVRVLQVLYGSIGAQTSVTLFVALVVHEKLQAIGSSYIFFVTKNGPKDPDPYTVLKLLPATDDNIARVTKLISN